MRIKPAGKIVIVLAAVALVVFFVWPKVIVPGVNWVTSKIASLSQTPTPTAQATRLPTTVVVQVKSTSAPTATATPAQKAATTAQPTSAATAAPTTVPATKPQPTSAPIAKQKLVVAFDSFGSYFPVIQVIQQNDGTYTVIPILFSFKTKEDDDPLNVFTEEERAAKIKSGEWDILLTTGDSLGKKGNIGKIVSIIDQSAGADKIVRWPESVTKPGVKIGKVNDLLGMSITYSDGSVGQFQALATLRLCPDLKPSDVKFLPAEDVASAVKLFTDKKADAVAGWEPDINGAIEAGGEELVSTSWWRNVTDVMVVSNNANATKREAVKAFLRDWYRALRLQQEDLSSAANMIANWEYNNQPTNPWTGVSKEKAEDDLVGWLEHIAQAGLGANSVLMKEPQMIADQLVVSREVWAWGGLVDTSISIDFLSMIEPSYVVELATEPGLFPSNGSLVNNTFQATSPSFPPTDAKALIDLPTLVEQQFRLNFKPNSSVIEPTDLAKVVQAARATTQMSKVARIQILDIGSSAWPLGYTEVQIWQQAKERALNVQIALINAGVNPNQVVISMVIPPENERRITDESRLAKYRTVTLEVKVVPGM